MIDCLKKGTSELIFLSLLCERSMHIHELLSEIDTRSKGIISLAGPYALIYRLERQGYIADVGKKIASDDRRRQFYGITEAGREYLSTLQKYYAAFANGVRNITGGA